MESESATKTPEETDSCRSYSVAEARNLIVPAVQVDSGMPSTINMQLGDTEDQTKVKYFSGIGSFILKLADEMLPIF